MIALVFGRFLSRSQTRPSEPPAPIEGEVPTSIEDETVEVVLEAIRELLQGEDRRADSLNSRGTGLGGFAGIIVSLSSGLAGQLVNRRIESLPASLLLGASVVVLVLAIALLLFGVLRTRSVLTTSIEEVQLYLDQRFLEKPPTWARGRIVATLAIRLAEQRRRNDAKATWLNRAATLVALGIAGAAGTGLTLLL